MAGSTAARISSLGPPPAPPLTKSLAEALARERLAGMADRDVELFVLRLARWWPDLIAAWSRVYGGHDRETIELRRLVATLADRYAERSDALRSLDLARLLRPDWFQDPAMIGYVCYADRFAGTLSGVVRHLDHLGLLGVRYLHLMPLLQPRDGETDGGYAVADYRAIDPVLGTMDDLEDLCAELRARDISLCIDLVLNHTAAEHPWALAAAAGDPAASAMYRIYPDRTMPDRFEASLPDVFPETAPGSFTQLPDGRWVWTTFNAYQWDLDWSNPTVFVEMADILLNLAGRGVEVFRLDAVAFMWKRMGTNCQNQPEVHDLLQALRACARITAPAVIFKAEAIVGPDELAAYLGVGRHAGRVSDMAYHNSLMVQYWSAMASRDARLMTTVLHGLPKKPVTTAWGAYIRCHDDIGWAVTEDDAATVDWDGRAHRAFLSDFYAGRFDGSFARGEVFQFEPGTGDSRISGTFASLAGLEAALEDGDPSLVELAARRIRLGHALIMAWDGIPLLYMGDEIGLLNDRSYAGDPDHAADNRWLHRPVMDWGIVEAARRAGTVGARLMTDLLHLTGIRQGTPQFHAAVPLDVVDLGDPRIFAFVRRHPEGSLLAIHNVSDGAAASVDRDDVPWLGGGVIRDLLDGSRWSARTPILVPALGVRWLVADEAPA